MLTFHFRSFSEHTWDIEKLQKNFPTSNIAVDKPDKSKGLSQEKADELLKVVFFCEIGQNLISLDQWSKYPTKAEGNVGIGTLYSAIFEHAMDFTDCGSVVDFGQLLHDAVRHYKNFIKTVFL